MKAPWMLVVVAAVVTLAACSILNPPVQCQSDDDCARFGATCDLGEAVCVARPETPPPLQTTFGAPIAGDAGAPRAAAAPSPSAVSEESAESPQPAADAGREGSVDGGRTLAVAIACGDTTCTSGVCCITDGTAACTAASDCATVKVSCDDTTDCTTGTICCAYNDGAGPALVRAKCVPSAQCDANGPQDQLCDPTKDQCSVAMDGRTACKPFDYTNATYDFCQNP